MKYVSKNQIKNQKIVKVFGRKYTGCENTPDLLFMSQQAL